MLIEYFGHDSFLIVSENGTKVITDPYEPGGFNGTMQYSPIGIAPDIVTVSHTHADHSCVQCLPEGFTVVSSVGNTTIKGVHITGVPSYHDEQYGAERGRNIIFVITIDHIRLCHLGDLGHELSPAEIEAIGDVDILFVPVGGKYTIGPAGATAVIGRVKPRIAIPMHYCTDKFDSDLLPVDEFLKGKKNVTILDKSELEIAKEQLPEQTRIIVMKHSC